LNLSILSRQKIKLLGFTLLLILGSACARDENGETPAPTAVSDTVAVDAEAAISATPSASPTPRPSPTPEPTPVVPTIAVADQVLTDEGQIEIMRAISTEVGWLVLYNQTEGELGDVLGATAVEPGLNTDLTITVDPLQAASTLVAMLHVDAGTLGEFEFPEGPDEPLRWETAVIASPFNLEFDLSRPVIVVDDQDVREDGLVTIESVLAPEAGWLLIHANEAGELGQVLGSAPLQAGRNENIQIHIPWREATPVLYAVIHQDAGRTQRLDYPGADTPLLVNDEPVIMSFTATYPPDIYVVDQPIIDGIFEVERVISNGPGWLVAYFDDEGEPGLIIGSVALEDGLNERVQVEVLESAITPVLHLRLHEDTMPGDEFDFPRVDPPVTYNGRLPNTFTFNTNPGNYLAVRDQALTPTEGGAATVTVPLVVVDVPAWLAIHTYEDGERGELLGFAPTELGVNHDVVVEIEAEAVTRRLYAVLHLDAGEEGEFEYPGGPDVPLQRNLRFVQVFFTVLDDAEGETTP